MRLSRIGVVAIVTIASWITPAYAFNNTGHMVVARLAWLNLSADQQAKVSALLKKHPHYSEFLKAGRPNNVDLNQWVFVRAATWPDWIKTHHTSDFAHNNWHYIDYPYVPPGSHASAPSVPAENAVKALNDLTAAFASADEDDEAIALCWFMHLIGDLHQPLHCVTMYSDEFPNGDRGGNRCLVMMGEHKVQLHKFFDGLLGSSTAPSAIFGMAQEIKALVTQNPTVISDDLSQHTTYESWAKEGFENAKTFVYLDASLKPANSDNEPEDDEIPDVPQYYQSNAGQMTRVSVAKAGERLAKTIQQLLQ